MEERLAWNGPLPFQSKPMPYGRPALAPRHGSMFAPMGHFEIVEASLFKLFLGEHVNGIKANA